ncbi:MAG: DUF721 domain-containing protein [Planctomycetes bacterium]|nr:DUF721 domain-containing protein [Planctomycetota bacterium]
MGEEGFYTIKEVLDKSFAMKLIRERARHAGLHDIWKQVAGEGVARVTRVSQYKDGKLHVAVLSAPLRQELATFRKEELLRGLRSHEPLAGIVDIVFKAG